MTVGATIEISGSEQTQRFLRQFEHTVDQGLKDGIRRSIPIADARLTRLLTGERLNVRSASLVRSARVDLIQDQQGVPAMRAAFAKGLVDRYAAAHEFGAVIKPKRARALSIPLRAAKDARGTPLYSGPRDPQLDGKTFLLPRDGKPPLIMRKDGDGESTPLFVLVKKVVIKRSAPLRTTILETKAQTLKNISQQITRRLTKAAGGAS